MLTGRQQEIWKFLTDYVDEHGYPPTVREIGEAVGLASPSTVHAHLANLERALYEGHCTATVIARDPRKLAVPEREFEETEHKAAAMRRAIEMAAETAAVPVAEAPA